MSSARRLLLRGCRIFDAPDPSSTVDILASGRVVERIGDVPADGEDLVLDVGGRTVIPGLIDMHIHGAGGGDVLDASPDALRQMSATLARLGTTSFVGTTFLWPAERNRHLRVAAEQVGRDLGGAALLGLYVEGPFINLERRGGIPPVAIAPASRHTLDEVLDLTDGTLRLMTVAPEIPGTLKIIEQLADRGVIPAFGHSGASYDEAREGIAAGIRHVTHLFNAMEGLHHRAPGPLVAISEAEHVTAELISDGVHLSQHVARWARRVLGAERCACITDAMRTAGLPDGRYRYGDRDFEACDGAARYLDGTLIGTSLGLLGIVERLRRFAGCSFAEAVRAATEIPARILGIADRKGSIAPGKDADLVVLNADHSVWATVVEGRMVYRQ